MIETIVQMNTYLLRTGKEFGRWLRVSGSLLTWAVVSQFSIKIKSHAILSALVKLMTYEVLKSQFS